MRSYIINFMKYRSSFFIILWVSILSQNILTAGELIGVRHSVEDNQIRLVFDFNESTEYNVFSLENPNRIVIDFFDTQLAGEINNLQNNPLIGDIRYSSRNQRDFRVVLNTRGLVEWSSFELNETSMQPNRVVLDIFSSPTTINDARNIIVAIDPGHGGNDPGATGPTGVREKNVTLAVARILKEELELYDGITAVLTRTSDRYVDLWDRNIIAREADADIFVSLHADAFRDPRVSGATIYSLSARGAGSEADRLLVNRENQSTILGDTDLREFPFPDLTDELISFYQEISIASAKVLGEHVIDQLATYTRVRKSDVQNAAFIVLRSPDVTSILIEMGYITNPREESMLSNPQGQRDIARGIRNGILSYLIENAPPDSLIAWNPPKLPSEPRRHTISWGETLSGIALRYQVSINRLRQANNLSNDNIYEGQIITIPPG